MDSHSKLIAHTGDLHFQIDQLDQATQSLKFIVDTAIERKCDALVIGGDVWERDILVNENSPFLPVYRLVQRAAASMPVVMCYGNHDRPGSLDPFAEIPNVYVFAAPTTLLVAGIHFSILPYPTKAFLMSQVKGSQDETDELANAALRQIIAGFAAEYTAESTQFGTALPHVLIYHGSVTGGKVESGQTMYGGDVMIGAVDLEMSGADVVLLNHYHTWQQLGSKCFYSGSTYHKSYGEVAPKYFNLVTVQRGACSVEKVRIFSRPRILLTADYAQPHIYGYEDGDVPDTTDAYVRVRVAMTSEQRAVFNEEDVKADFPKAHRVKVEPVVIPTLKLRGTDVTKARTLREKVIVYAKASGDAELDAALLDLVDEIEREGM